MAGKSRAGGSAALRRASRVATVRARFGPPTVDYRFAPGSTFAGYTIDAPLGSGCAGETYRARRAGTRINVALKIAWPELAAAHGFAFEMQRQAKILQRFRHPHLCAVLDAGISKGLPFWASEFVPGPDGGEPFTLKDYLKDRIARGKQIGEDEVFIIAGEIIGTIAALHNFRDREECPNGIALGDLRPVNILLDADTKFRLCDLGISALVRATTGAFTEAKGIGLGYMSPEVRAGNPPTPRSDVYSIGAILYELLTGRKFSGDAPPPSKLRQGIKTGWDGLLMQRCLVENPDDRIADMASLKKIIENLEHAKPTRTLVLSKKTETQEVLPDTGSVPADLAGQTTIAKPKSIVLRKKGVPRDEERKPAVPEQIAQAETIAFTRPAPKRTEPAPAAPAKKSRAPLWIALAAVVACAALGGGWYALSRSKAAAAQATNAAAVAAATAASAPKITEGQPFTLTTAPLEMKWIPASSNILLGTDAADQKALEPGLPPGEASFLGSEKPRTAGLPTGYWMAATETTIAHWKKFAAANPDFKTTAEKKGIAATVRTNGALEDLAGISWRNPVPAAPPPDTHPVTCVTPADIQAFCAWLTNRERDAGRISPEYTFRLPTSIEWEHACRAAATERTRFWWGSDVAAGAGRLNAAGTEYAEKFPATAQYAFPWRDPHLHTAPAGSFGEKGRNAYGLSDTLGNVWECVIHGPPASRDYAWRGGSFAEGHTVVRSASTRHRYTDKPSANAGFRLVLSK